jgi:hypothetical protein
MLRQEKDERTESVEKSSYSLAYKFVTYAILLDVVYRAVLLETAAWDLLGIVIAGGLVATIYQTRFRMANRSWVKAILLSMLGAAVIAIVLVLLRAQLPR